MEEYIKGVLVKSGRAKAPSGEYSLLRWGAMAAVLDFGMDHLKGGYDSVLTELHRGGQRAKNMLKEMDVALEDAHAGTLPRPFTSKQAVKYLHNAFVAHAQDAFPSFAEGFLLATFDLDAQHRVLNVRAFNARRDSCSFKPGFRPMDVAAPEGLPIPPALADLILKEFVPEDSQYAFHYGAITATLNIAPAEFERRRAVVRSVAAACLEAEKKDRGAAARRVLQALDTGGTVFVDSGTDPKTCNTVCNSVLLLVALEQMPPSGEHYGIVHHKVVGRNSGGVPKIVFDEIY